MKLLVFLVALVIAVVSAEPQVLRHYLVKENTGILYRHYRGQRSADAEPELGFFPIGGGYYGGYYGRGYGKYPWAGKRLADSKPEEHYLGRRSADAKPQLDRVPIGGGYFGGHYGRGYGGYRNEPWGIKRSADSKPEEHYLGKRSSDAKPQLDRVPIGGGYFGGHYARGYGGYRNAPWGIKRSADSKPEERYLGKRSADAKHQLDRVPIGGGYFGGHYGRGYGGYRNAP